MKILQYLKAVYIGPCLHVMHQNTKYAHLLVKLSKIVGADTFLQTKLGTVFGLLSLSHSLLRNLQIAALWLSDMPAFGMLTAVSLRQFLTKDLQIYCNNIVVSRNIASPCQFRAGSLVAIVQSRLSKRVSS